MGSVAKSRPSVVLIDREDLSRQGIRLVLEREGFEVLTDTGDGDIAAESVRCFRPDVIVAELNVACVSGLALIRELRQVSPGSSILVLLDGASSVSAGEILRLGVKGLCLRDSGMAEFRRSLEALLHGEMYLCPRAAGSVGAVGELDGDVDVSARMDLPGLPGVGLGDGGGSVRWPVLDVVTTLALMRTGRPMA